MIESFEKVDFTHMQAAHLKTVMLTLNLMFPEKYVKAVLLCNGVIAVIWYFGSGVYSDYRKTDPHMDLFWVRALVVLCVFAVGTYGVPVILLVMGLMFVLRTLGIKK